MKVVILAGGFGTRISEESYLKPKPMIEIGNIPILCHIMKLYSYYGHNDFIICAGYKQELIKEYFANYYLHRSDITFDFANDNKIIIHNNIADPWKVTIVDTGLNTMTGGRIKRIKNYIDDELFMLTYGDGLSDVNINNLLEYHKKHNKIATLTTVRLEGRFGIIDIQDGKVSSFREKSIDDTGWVNAGYMVLNKEIFNYIEGDNTTFEQKPLSELARTGELMAYKHTGFWHCMDTIRDKEKLEMYWNQNNAPWKVWE